VKARFTKFEDVSLSTHATKALKEGWVKPNKRIFNDAKVSDHHAIVPTGVAPKNLDEYEQKLYDMVARRFIAVFYPPAQFEVTTRITRVEGEAFKTDGKIITDPGWLAVYGKQGLRELAVQNLSKAHYLAGKTKTIFNGPFFNEFVVRAESKGVAEINRELELKKIIGGLALKKFYPELSHAALLCATEMSKREHMDTVAGAF